MATLRKENGRWRALFFTPDGKERRVTFKSTNAKAVKAVWSQIEGALALGTYRDEDFVRYWVRPPADYAAKQKQLQREKEKAEANSKKDEKTFGDFAEEWYSLKKHNLAKSGARDYRSILDKYLIPVLGKVRLSEFKIDHVDELKKVMYEPEKKTRYKKDKDGNYIRGKRGKKLRETVMVAPTPGRINNVLIPLKTILIEAHDRDLLPKVPKIKKEKEPRKRTMQPLAQNEVELFLSKVEPHYHAAFAFAFGTGVRAPGELSAIQIGDIDFNRKRVDIKRVFSGGKVRHTTKTYEERSVDLSPELVDILKAHLKEKGRIFSAEPEDFLFVNEAGGHLDGNNMRNRVWKRTLKRCGISYRPMYNTRHTYASIMLMNPKNSVLYVSQQLGHANPMTTLKYYAKYIPSMGNVQHVSLGSGCKDDNDYESWHLIGTSGKKSG